MIAYSFSVIAFHLAYMYCTHVSECYMYFTSILTCPCGPSHSVRKIIDIFQCAHPSSVAYCSPLRQKAITDFWNPAAHNTSYKNSTIRPRKSRYSTLAPCHLFSCSEKCLRDSSFLVDYTIPPTSPRTINAALLSPPYSSPYSPTAPHRRESCTCARKSKSMTNGGGTPPPPGGMHRPPLAPSLCFSSCLLSQAVN